MHLKTTPLTETDSFKYLHKEYKYQLIILGEVTKIKAKYKKVGKRIDSNDIEN